MPNVIVDDADPTPPYEQIRRQVADAIRAGRLPSGQKLPPVRQLAGDLRVAPGTVARAYKELEAAVLVITRRAAGTRVAELPQGRPQVGDQLEHAATTFIADAHRLGASDDDIRAVIHRLLD